MAFVLVAFMILIGLAAVFYVSITGTGLRTQAADIKHEQAREMVRKLSGSPELVWTADDCSSCVDFDKIMALKSSSTYGELWGRDIVLMQIKKVYPSSGAEIECALVNYPDCNKITLVEREGDYTSEEAFVALCRINDNGIGRLCEIGKIVLGVREI